MLCFSTLGYLKSTKSVIDKPEILQLNPSIGLFKVSSSEKRTKSGKSKYDFSLQLDGKEYLIEALISDGLKPLKVGSYIALRSPFIRPLKATKNPVAFDYGLYLIQKGYSAQLFAKASDLVVCSSESMAFLPLFTRWQLKAEEFILKLPLGARSRELLPALLIGSKKQMSPEFKDSFQASGVIHLLAVSGLHLGLIYLAFQFVFKKFGLPKWAFQIVTILPLWFYAGLVGFTVSVVRAAFMFTVLGLSHTYKKSHSLTHWLAAGGALLFYSPDYIEEIGFQLSFSAVAGILLLNPIIHKYNRSKIKAIRILFAATGISLAAQLATFPIIYHHFGSFPTYFLPANLIVIPLITVIHYSSSLVVLLSTFLCLPGWIFLIIEYLVELSFAIAQFFSILPFAVLQLKPLQPNFIYFCVALVTSMSIFSRLKIARYNKQLYLFIIPLIIAGFIKLNKTKSQLCFHQSEKAWTISYNSSDSTVVYYDRELKTPPKVDYILNPMSSNVIANQNRNSILSVPGGLVGILNFSHGQESEMAAQCRWLLLKEPDSRKWKLKEFNLKGELVLAVSLSDTALVYTD